MSAGRVWDVHGWLAACRHAVRAGAGAGAGVGGGVREYVVGNESADLDSVASAIVAAACLGGGAVDSGADASAGVVVPVVNISPADFVLRTEAVAALASCLGVAPTELVYMEDIAEVASGARVTLVDHNVLTGTGPVVDVLGARVERIIDHHVDEGAYPSVTGAARAVQVTGSAASLVARELGGSGALDAQPGLARLLLDAVLVDTVNLSEAAKKTTPVDKAAVAQLAPLAFGAECDDLAARCAAEYEALSKAKFDMGGLSAHDVLRRDAKHYVSDRGLRYGIPGVLMAGDAFVAKAGGEAGMCEALQAYGKATEAEFLVVMMTHPVEGDPPLVRELMVWAGDDAKGGSGVADVFAGLVDLFEGSDLELTQVGSGAGGPGRWVWWTQANIRASRKAVAPMLADYVSKVVEGHPRVPRFEMDADDFATAQAYLVNRTEQALATADTRGGWVWEGPVQELGWGASLAVRDVASNMVYHATYVYASERGRGRFSAWYGGFEAPPAMVTFPDCGLESFFDAKGIDYVVMGKPAWDEYAWIEAEYGDKVARRSRLHLMNHIDEGLFVLNSIGASEAAKRAYALHPLVQGDEELAQFLCNASAMATVSPYVLALAIEYRSTANAYLSSAPGDVNPKLSPLPEVNDMLIADKIQNRLDFERAHLGSHPNSERLVEYFGQWLDALGVDEDMYQSFAAAIRQRTGRL